MKKNDGAYYQNFSFTALPWIDSFWASVARDPDVYLVINGNRYRLRDVPESEVRNLPGNKNPVSERKLYTFNNRSIDFLFNQGKLVSCTILDLDSQFGFAASADGPVLTLPATKEELEAVFGPPLKWAPAGGPPRPPW